MSKFAESFVIIVFFFRPYDKGKKKSDKKRERRLSMRKKRLLSLLGVGAAICLAKPHLLYANPTFGGGNGTERNPYQLSTPEHLTELQVAVDGGNSFNGKYFVLTNDIDFDGYDNDSNPNNGNFEGIGTESNRFSGHFDGKNYAIKNLRIIKPSTRHVGLFDGLTDATVENLKLENYYLEGLTSVGGLTATTRGDLNQIKNITISGEVKAQNHSGGLIGQVQGNTKLDQISGTIIVNGNKKSDSEPISCVGGLVGQMTNGLAVSFSNISLEGSVSAKGNSVGGITGFFSSGDTTNSLQIENVSFVGNVTGMNYVGGLIGYMKNGIVQNSSVKGETSGSVWVGGVTGYSINSTVTESSVSGDVLGINCVGGVTGYSIDSTVAKSSVSGDVSGSSGDVGGLIGYASDSTVTESSVSGDVSGSSGTGGLVGRLDSSTITKSFVMGNISGEGYTGGVIGFGKNTILTESFSQGQVSGVEGIGGLVGEASQPLVIVDCYSLSDVTGDLLVGGLVGSVDDSYYSNEVAIFENSYYDGFVTGLQATGKLVGHLGWYNRYDDVWCDGVVSMDNVYLNQEKNTNYPLFGDTTHGTIEKENIVELTTTQMSQSNSKNHMTALDFETIWMTTSTTPMFQWQNDLVSANQGDIQINGNVQPMIADVTIPSVSPDLVIDPNSPDGAVSPEFEIQNDSNSPIRLELKTFEQITNSFNDVLPDKYDLWEGLNRKESQDIALGLIAKEGEGWQRLTNSTSYVANHTEHEIGVMKPMSQVNFEFEVHHGRAFSESKTIQYKMVFVFDLLN